MQKNIVITGASGRLGSSLIEHFSQSSQVRVFPVSSQEREGFYSYERLFTDAFLQRTDVILHLAWSSVPKVSEEKFGGEWLIDIPLLVRILQAIRSGGHDHIHFIFFSSAGTVYGRQGHEAVSETTQCNPANMYGWSKLHAEQLLQQFAMRFPLGLTILRISNVYGIGSRPSDQQGVIPFIIKAALDNIEVSIWGDGSAQKDYLHAVDLLDVVEKIIIDRLTGLYNVCFGRSYSLHDIIEKVELTTGKTVKLRYLPAPVWDNDHVVVDGRKLCELLDWKPNTNIEEGVERTLETVMSHLKKFTQS